MGRSLYSTVKWQRLRLAILQRDGRVCQIAGPKCTGFADTAHHLVPSSLAPERFFDPSNVVAACRRCNYSGGPSVRTDNRTNRLLVLHLQEVVEEQAALVEEQAEEIAELRRELGQRAEPSATPRIY
jgi:5-methylcytosine-specific restriction endonuclease McrA